MKHNMSFGNKPAYIGIALALAGILIVSLMMTPSVEGFREGIDDPIQKAQKEVNRAAAKVKMAKLNGLKSKKMAMDANGKLEKEKAQLAEAERILEEKKIILEELKAASEQPSIEQPSI